MQVLLFLLDTLFFILVGAALLRGWMNTRRMRMSQQPGMFVMAITDWLVGPLRRTLPKRWMQSNTDWGSFMAALLLCLAYSVLWHVFQRVAVLNMSGLPWVVTVLVVAFQFLLRTCLQGLLMLSLAYALLSWVQPKSTTQNALARLVEPVLGPIRKVVLPIGGVDLSVLVLVILLQIGLMVLT